MERIIDQLRESQLQIVVLTRKQTGETYVDNKMSCAKPCSYFGTAGDGVSPSSYEGCFRIHRLERLEHAVEQLQKRNAELEAEVRSLKQPTAAVPDGKFKTKVNYDGKTYVEQAVPAPEKQPLFVQQRGPELKLVLGGYVQINFEDGDVSAFEGRLARLR